MKSSFRMLVLVVVLAAIAIPLETQARPLVETFRNPLDVTIADPQIFRDGDTYYLYGTTSNRGFEVWSSKDIVNWRKHGYCWDKTPSTWTQDFFWAPEVIKSGSTYYMFHTGAPAKSWRLRVCVSSAPSPLGPFTELATPLVEDTTPRSEGVRVNCFDPSPFRDPTTGRYYVYWAQDMTQAGLGYGSIGGGRLAPDMKSLDVGPVLCLVGDQKWEIGDRGKPFIEGPSVMKHGSTYYMQYSGSAWYSNKYAVGYATAPSPLGPWTKSPDNPILKTTDSVFGTGHGGFTTSPDGKEDYIVYHSHITSDTANRQLAIDRIAFVPNGDKPDRMGLANGPTISPQPYPSGAPARRYGRSDEFRKIGVLDRAIWNVFNENAKTWRIANGQLEIDTEDGDLWQDRGDAANVFLQYVQPGDFAISTKVNFAPKANFEQAFLIFWQDQSNYVKVSTVYADARKFDTTCELRGETQVTACPNTIGDTVYLRIDKRGDRYTPSYSADGKQWTPLGKGFDAKFANLKVGLGAYAPVSKAKRTAKFDYLRIEAKPVPASLNRPTANR